MSSLTPFPAPRLLWIAATTFVATAAMAACGGDAVPHDTTTVAASTIAFDSAHTLSAVTQVGAAPILALAPDGRHATAWVSAPDGGTDGRLHVLVARDGDTTQVLRELTDPWAPSSHTAKRRPNWLGRHGLVVRPPSVRSTWWASSYRVVVFRPVPCGSCVRMMVAPPGAHRSPSPMTPRRGSPTARTLVRTTSMRCMPHRMAHSTWRGSMDARASRRCT